jgi:hypothetical protein
VLVVQVVDRVEDPQCREHRTLGVVFVRDRGAEDSHDCIADELLDCAAEAFDLPFHARVIRTQRCADSGSARSDRAVKPTRSTKRIETTFRSSAPVRSISASAEPHDQQNLARSGLSSPQFREAGIPRV